MTVKKSIFLMLAIVSAYLPNENTLKDVLTHVVLPKNILDRKVTELSFGQNRCPPASPELAMAAGRRQVLCIIICRGIERPPEAKSLMIEF